MSTAPVPASPSATPATEATRPPRRWPVWVRGIVLPLVLTVAYYAPALGLILLLESVGPDTVNPQSGIAAVLPWVIPVTLVVLIVLVMRFVDRRPLRDTGLFVSAGSLPALLLGAVAAAVVVMPLGFWMQAQGWLRGGEAYTAEPLALFLLGGLVPALVVQGFPEELLWRGYLMQTLPLRSPWAIVLWSSGLFALIHLISSGGQENLAERFLYLLPAFGFGFLAAALYRATGQLWAAVGVHAGMHTASQTTGYFGVGDGPALWLAQTVGYLLIGVLVMLWCDRRRPAEHIFAARAERLNT